MSRRRGLMRRYTARAMARPPIVLASTSRYRRELLQRLRISFDVQSPPVDETALGGEAPRDTALRLAIAKASAVSAMRPGSVVIGSDQVAEIDGEALGKPLEHEAALAQLLRMQGRAVVFHTALAVAGPDAGRIQADSVPTVVRMRTLPSNALEAYLRADEPYDCAGAAKIESLGIALVEQVLSDDPTALIGLPLIRLTAMLASAGVAVLPTE
jgi:septum formation protein